MSNALERIEDTIAEMAKDEVVPCTVCLVMTDKTIADLRALCKALREALRPVRVEPPMKSPKVHPARDKWYQRRGDRDRHGDLVRWDHYWFAGRDASTRALRKRVRDRLAETERDDG